MNSIIYLHGFNSSAASTKAQQLFKLLTALGCAEHLRLPALDNDPAQAAVTIDKAINASTQPLLVGSSLGGFYATYFAQKYQLPAILINPAVTPHTLFAGRLGPQRNYHDGSEWELTKAHVDALEALVVPKPKAAERIEVWLQTGDETLDYRVALDYYQGCLVDVEEGGDHSYQGFVYKLPKILARAGMDAARWRDFDFSTLETRTHGTDL